MLYVNVNSVQSVGFIILESILIVHREVIDKHNEFIKPVKQFISHCLKHFLVAYSDLFVVYISTSLSSSADSKQY